MPVISYLIVLVCIVVYYFQYQSDLSFEANSSSFCHQLQKNKMPDAMDKMVADQYLCQQILKRIEERPDLTVEEIINEYFWFQDLTALQINKLTAFIKQHYARYNDRYPAHIDKDLMYFPETLNPVKMLTSSLAHADIWHIAGNIIFFLAFAPAIEILLASAWLYIASCLIIIVSTSIAYTVSVFVMADSLPALGLSGLVMGMMGLFAALMPREKIKVFIWLLFFVRNISVPAWILALWYIGLDSLDLLLGTGDPSINLVAHVSGGVTGYLLGHIWLKTDRLKTI